LSATLPRRFVASAMNKASSDFSLALSELGSSGSVFYLIMSGEADVFKTDVVVAGAGTSAEVVVGRLGPGSYFGEVRVLVYPSVLGYVARFILRDANYYLWQQALLQQERTRLASVRAVGPVQCLCVHQEFFSTLMSQLTVRVVMCNCSRVPSFAHARVGVFRVWSSLVISGSA
jgi:CRP-like cAMP-binding protein